MAATAPAAPAAQGLDWRIVRGTPNAEELAALVAVLLTRTRPVPDSSPSLQAPSRWARSARPVAGRLPRPGPQAWRGSALPR
ncbi:acyl-CoA carboxylase subunit epsilon [Solwaraspora sp. WMMD406]|uniref:acyl-CoA carboxylase subunit epsilon n=1 Tax=Solwaraspora sp. WMMD406 TaxID=3016095 RepID=UPI0024179A8F|nr:acyl-CoA carboxylase subunit epsilon [Solwaraspora sp. WMMD406]MDG4767863.1 acyl-CoA carboxylase subunit epsilon [Solwaraspora sp. WMMD406]